LEERQVVEQVLKKKKKNLGIEATTRGLRLIQKPLWIPFSRGSISLDKGGATIQGSA
jgi:hypothetical protein